MKTVSFVSCTRGKMQQTALYRSLQKLRINDVIFHEENTVGLSERYNQALNSERRKNHIIVFCHDDVLIADAFIIEKLNDAVSKNDFAIIGLAGSADYRIDLRQRTFEWHQPAHGTAHLSGAVDHEFSDGTYRVLEFGPTPKRVVILDGLFLAVDIDRIGSVRFDEDFSFHFYDLDFCLSAHTSGLKLGTYNIYVCHQSLGSFNTPSYFSAQQRFLRKWRPRLGIQDA